LRMLRVPGRCGQVPGNSMSVQALPAPGLGTSSSCCFRLP
jgi:hypothetical protein